MKLHNALLQGACLCGIAQATNSLGFSTDPPIPSQDLLAWQQSEIGVIIHFNMATMAKTQGCQGPPPDISLWNPSNLDTDQWVDAMVNLGAKYAVYVAKHGCGFCTWPTSASLSFLPDEK